MAEETNNKPRNLKLLDVQYDVETACNLEGFSKRQTFAATRLFKGMGDNTLANWRFLFKQHKIK